jgi:hypothetical protein
VCGLYSGWEGLPLLKPSFSARLPQQCTNYDVDGRLGATRASKRAQLQVLGDVEIKWDFQSEAGINSSTSFATRLRGTLLSDIRLSSLLLIHLFSKRIIVRLDPLLYSAQPPHPLRPHQSSTCISRSSSTFSHGSDSTLRTSSSSGLCPKQPKIRTTVRSLRPLSHICRPKT